MSTQRIHIGTSGWSYDHWQGKFYPEGLAGDRRLSYYQQYFRTVEVNSSFYNLPSKSTLHHWYESVDDNFTFAVKASRYITHMKKLRDPKRTIREFMSRVQTLDNKLGPILFQLPPRWHVNVERLTDFLKMLPREYRYAIEFRDPSWFTERIYDLLTNFSVAFCIFDLDGKLSPLHATADFIYVRLHGPKAPYRGSYDNRALHHWAKLIGRWRDEGRATYCYFDNDEAAFAVRNAAYLQKALKLC